MTPNNGSQYVITCSAPKAINNTSADFTNKREISGANRIARNDLTGVANVWCKTAKE